MCCEEETRHVVMGPDGVRGLQRRWGPRVVWGRRYLRENVKGEEHWPGLLKETGTLWGTEQRALRFRDETNGRR